MNYGKKGVTEKQKALNAKSPKVGRKFFLLFLKVFLVVFVSVGIIAASGAFGIVKGVNAKENYAKHFLDIGAGAIYGFDYCWWPNGASAYSFTIGTSYGVYGGYDYYWCLD